MPATPKLSDDDVTRELAMLDGWTREDDKIFREYTFADFVTAFSFMAGIALVAEKMDHHPTWLNVYAKVCVHLTTHDVGGLSAFDFQFARTMDAHARRLMA